MTKEKKEKIMVSPIAGDYTSRNRPTSPCILFECLKAMYGINTLANASFYIAKGKPY